MVTGKCWLVSTVDSGHCHAAAADAADSARWRMLLPSPAIRSATALVFAYACPTHFCSPGRAILVHPCPLRLDAASSLRSLLPLTSSRPTLPSPCTTVMRSSRPLARTMRRALSHAPAEPSTAITRAAPACNIRSTHRQHRHASACRTRPQPPLIKYKQASLLCPVAASPPASLFFTGPHGPGAPWPPGATAAPGHSPRPEPSFPPASQALAPRARPTSATGPEQPGADEWVRDLFDVQLAGESAAYFG